MKCQMRFKMYALCDAASGELLLDNLAKPLSSLSQTLLREMADENGWRGWSVKEIDPVSADVEIDDRDLKAWLKKGVA